MSDHMQILFLFLSLAGAAVACQCMQICTTTVLMTLEVFYLCGGPAVAPRTRLFLPSDGLGGVVACLLLSSSFFFFKDHTGDVWAG